MNLTEILEYYSTDGAITRAKQSPVLFKELPTDISALCQVVQGMLIHIFWIQSYGLTHTEERKNEVNLRFVSKQLQKIQQLDDKPLSEPRCAENKLIGNCRDFSTLLTAMLRFQGVPARARCGFARYFSDDSYEDHWLCEYWNKNQQRWVMVDAQMDQIQSEKLGIDFDPLDVPAEQFLLAGQAWQMHKQDLVDAGKFGIHQHRGVGFIIGNLIRDFLALNKVELLPWDNLSFAVKNENDLAVSEANLIEKLTKLTLTGNPAFIELRKAFEDNKLWKLPAKWIEDQSEVVSRKS